MLQNKAETVHCKKVAIRHSMQNYCQRQIEIVSILVLQFFSCLSTERRYVVENVKSYKKEFIIAVYISSFLQSHLCVKAKKKRVSIQVFSRYPAAIHYKFDCFSVLSQKKKKYRTEWEKEKTSFILK